MPTTVYWDRPTWDRARAAYMADLDTLESSPTAFLWWLHRCLGVYSDLSPASRDRIRRRHPDPARGTGQGFSRMHTLRTDLLDRIDGAIVRDRRDLGQMVSVSQFCREAARAAADAAEQRLGRGLPPAPGRLLNNPRRKRRD